MTEMLRGGIDVAMKVPPHQFEATVAFYRDVAMFMPLRPDATETDVQAFFASLDGGPPAPFPFTGRNVGSPPLSPGRSTVLQLRLPPGRYALVTFVFDFDDGLNLTAKGMHRIVTVTP